MQLISTFNKEIRLLLRAIDVFIKYAWVTSLKDKTALMLFKRYWIDLQAN